MQADGAETFVDGAGVIRSSDQNLKTNIRPLENSLFLLKNLEAKTYEWKKSGRKDIGVVAQEVEKVLPHLVETLPNGYKAVRYEGLIPVLLQAIKEGRIEAETV